MSIRGGGEKGNNIGIARNQTDDWEKGRGEGDG